MKKSVQALLNRRRARYAQMVFAALALLGVLAIVFILFSFATDGPLAQLLATPTPTFTPTLPPSSTPSPNPATPTPKFTDTPTPTEGPSPTPTPITYVVVEGDTLFSIALQFTTTVDAIAIANGIAITAPLSIGQTLIIPQPGSVQTPTPTPLPTGLPRGARIQYTVMLGDTLEIIAAKFNSTPEDIARQNRRNNKDLTNADLRAGDVLIVRINLVTPVPTATATPTAASTTTATGTATP
ncbi:MAG: LysM peptidoglycan-binding domain-containing protein [Anaerolineales bacterium]|nr:LysM peptidoglycan-binding domain-containing protein [Anaerolineales bacterium]